MHVVTPFAADLLRLLATVLGRQPRATGLQILQRYHADRPYKAGEWNLPASAVELIRDALRKGCVSKLVTEGGWPRERFLRRQPAGTGDEHELVPVTGRLWERQIPAALALTFSSQVIRSLCELTADVDGGDWPADIPPATTAGDCWFHAELYDTFRDCTAAERWRKHSLFTLSPLVRLLDPLGFSGNLPLPDFSAALRDGSLLMLLEALQSRFAHRWIAAEQRKRDLSTAELDDFSTPQSRLLNAWLDACEQHNRRDLSRFLLTTLQHLQPVADKAVADPNRTPWFRGQDEVARSPAEQLVLRERAMCVFAATERFANWTRWARATGYYDDDYAAAQLWLLDQEEYYGSTILQTARKLQTMELSDA